jgi:oligopeptide transport system substrate-binding protein
MSLRSVVATDCAFQDNARKRDWASVIINADPFALVDSMRKVIHLSPSNSGQAMPTSPLHVPCRSENCPSSAWRIQAILCILLPLCLFLNSCARHETPAEKGLRTHALLLGNGAEPSDLDPQIATAYTDMNIMVALFEGLTVLDEASSRPLPGIAERWESSSDGLVWTFHLRPQALWSDGTPLVAEDFVFSFRRILQPKLAAEFAYMLWPLKNARSLTMGHLSDVSLLGAQALDSHTLQLTLESPCPWFLTLVSNQAWFPVPRHAIEQNGPWDQRGTKWTRPGKLVCNGAYTLKEWTPNARLVVVKNPRYWDAERTRIDSIVFFPNENMATDERNFRTGQLHATYDLPPEKIEVYRKENPASLRIDPFFETFLLRFNTTKGPLSDPRVRKALAEAIDREALCSTVLRGSRYPARSLTPPGVPNYTPVEGPGWNPDEARRLLKEAGFANGRGFPPLELQFKSDDIHRSVMETIQQMWLKELGVRVSLAPLEQQTWLANQASLSYEVSSWRWIGDYLDANTFLDLWTTNGGKNQTGWSSREYDRLVLQAAGTRDDSLRNALQRQAESIVLNEAPISPIFHGSRVYLIHPAVHNWPPSLLGLRRYQYVELGK